MAKILIVDDESSIRRTLRDILEFEKYEIDEAVDGFDAIIKIKQQKYDVILMDVRMPKMDGLEALEKMQIITPETPVIMISGNADIDTAVEAVKKGAFDFISKPPDLNRLFITIRNAMDRSNLINKTQVLKRKVAQYETQEIIGEAEPIMKIKEMIDTVAARDSRVLVMGPNGSGKELVARWIHEKSSRNTGPMIEVNCAAIPSELIESELFGHMKGSFTGAVRDHVGKFEQANGGTLFLDEIGDMSLAAQAKVLRALETQRITRVGGDREIKVDVRVIAATNKNLLKEIERNNFREDLYYRLAVMIMEVPSLNERSEDMPLLVHHFIRIFCNEHGYPEKTITEEAIDLLKTYNWRGNIRELRNVMERLVILSGDNISEEDVRRYVLGKYYTGRNRFQELFDRFDNLEEIYKLIESEFWKYKGTVKNV